MKKYVECFYVEKFEIDYTAVTCTNYNFKRYSEFSLNEEESYWMEEESELITMI